MTPRDDSAFEQKIIANVREHGCHINYVFDPDGEMPAYAYSVGFQETVGQPEVIVFGLSMDVMKFMINQTLQQCREGLLLEDGAELNGLLEGHRCIVCEVSPANITREFFNSAIWFRNHVAGEEMDAAFQIVWPGAKDGLFPWEEGCSDIVQNLQPNMSGEAVA